MNRAMAIAAVVLTGASTLVVASLIATGSTQNKTPDAGNSPDPMMRHGFLHVNCPPGSHGKRRTLGVGADVLKARETARAARQDQK